MSWNGSYIGKHSVNDVTIINHGNIPHCRYIFLIWEEQRYHGFLLNVNDFVLAVMDRLAEQFGMHSLGMHTLHLAGRPHVLIKPFIGYSVKEVLHLVSGSQEIRTKISNVVGLYKAFGFSIGYHHLYLIKVSNGVDNEEKPVYEVACIGNILHKPKKHSLIKEVNCDEFLETKLQITPSNSLEKYQELSDLIGKIMLDIGEISCSCKGMLLSSVPFNN